MKAYQIALFLVLFQVSAAFIEYSGVFPDNTFTYDKSNLDQWKAGANSSGFTDAGQDTDKGATELMQSKGLFSIILDAIRPWTTFQNLGLPDDISYLLTVPIYAIWIAALIQFVRGSSFSGQA